MKDRSVQSCAAAINRVRKALHYCGTNMVHEYLILEGAQRDYEGIVRYLAGNLASPSAADRFMDEFDRQIEIVCENPHLHARSRIPELAALGYRLFFVGSYVALYTVREGTVVVAHVFHQLQDYARIAAQRPEN